VTFRCIRVSAVALIFALAASWALTSCGKSGAGGAGNVEEKRQKAMQEGEQMKATMGGKLAEQAKAPPPAKAAK
jgi:hypothetical protein